MAGLLAAPTTQTAAPASKGAGLLRGTAAPVNAPVSPPSNYFYTKNPDGSTIGASDQSDPYSGKPYFAYRLPEADATTTDKTRVATTFNPETAQPESFDDVKNPRMPASASQNIRAEEGATSDQELDHAMALALSGSNAPENLRLIPTKQNQDASGSEGQLEKDVATGKKSLFAAQKEEAEGKGIPTPFLDLPEQITPQRASWLDTIMHTFEKLPSELSGIANPFLHHGTT